MQLQAIDIRNYRTLTQVGIGPGKINVITGPNGSGKSSTLEAIAFLLTGKADSNCVKTGEECATVSAVVMGTPLERKVGKKTSVRLNGKATTQKSVMEWVEDSTGITADTLRVATSSGILAAMNGRQLAEYLINNNLIPVEIDMDTMKMLCTISPEAFAELEMMLPPAPDKFGLDAIQEAYNHFYTARPQAKRQLAEAQTRAKANSMCKPEHTLEYIDHELARIATYNTELDAYNRLNQAYMAAQQKARIHREQIAALAEQLVRCAAEPVDPQELGAFRENRRKAEELRREAAGEKKTLEANMAMFRRTLESLDKPVCPISNKLVCTTDKTAIKNELQTLLEQNGTLYAAAQKKEEDAIAQLQNLDAKIADHERRAQAYQQYKSLYERKQALESVVPAIPAMPSQPKAIENAELLAAQLKAERAAIFAFQAAQKAAAEIPALESQLKVYEELIALLRPQGGIREKIVEAAFEPLVEHCNERAETLRAGFRINLVSNDGIQIMCKPNGTTDMLPLSDVSTGEQALAMLLVMDAINALSGLGILLLDDLDKLDATALDALLTLLENPDVAEPYDHIFVAMVNHEDSMKVLKKHEHCIATHLAL